MANAPLTTIAPPRAAGGATCRPSASAANLDLRASALAAPCGIRKNAFIRTGPLFLIVRSRTAPSQPIASHTGGLLENVLHTNARHMSGLAVVKVVRVAV